LAREKFVLSLPDFGPQNIMTDEQGNLTGITDWGKVQTVPRFLDILAFRAGLLETGTLSFAITLPYN